jgi:hypothetical protein
MDSCFHELINKKCLNATAYILEVTSHLLVCLVWSVLLNHFDFHLLPLLSYAYLCHELWKRNKHELAADTEFLYGPIDSSTVRAAR